MNREEERQKLVEKTNICLKEMFGFYAPKNKDLAEKISTAIENIEEAKENSLTQADENLIRSIEPLSNLWKSRCHHISECSRIKSLNVSAFVGKALDVTIEEAQKDAEKYAAIYATNAQLFFGQVQH